MTGERSDCGIKGCVLPVGHSGYCDSPALRPSKEKVLPKTDLEWIAHTLSDAEAAIKVLSTMLAKEGLKMGFAVADEILGNVRSAQKNCSHLITRERTAHEPATDYRAALKWALEHGVKSQPWNDNDGFRDAGCSCCSCSIEPPAEFEAIVREIRRELVAEYEAAEAARKAK